MSDARDGLEDRVRAFTAVHIDARATDGGAGGAARVTREERVAHEEPLEIQVNGASVAVVMRTPGDDEELGLGFLLTERVVRSARDVESIRHCTTAPDVEAEENVLQVRLVPPERGGVALDLERLRRHTYASSSCGVCGKATIENACAVAAPLSDTHAIEAAVLAALVPALRAEQAAFDATGGLHGAAAFALDGALRVAREDVGRHNAVDKVVGHLARQDLSAEGGAGGGADGAARAAALVVSGRVSFEIVQKAAAARIPIVAGVSAPTSLAVRMARALDVTLVGFLRGATMNVYAGERRVRTRAGDR